MCKNEYNENNKTTIPFNNYNRTKTIGECGIFYICVLHITNDERCTCEIKSRIAMKKLCSKRKKHCSIANWT